VARTSRCNAGNVVGGTIVLAGQFVDDGAFLCSPWLPDQRQPKFSASGRCTTGFKEGHGGVQGDTFFCPSGKAGKAIRGKHGININSLHFVCDD
jgi:hypothetical protein